MLELNIGCSYCSRTYSWDLKREKNNQVRLRSEVEILSGPFGENGQQGD